MANTSGAQQVNIEAGQNIVMTMTKGQNLVLSSATEVQGMKLTGDGALVLTLSDGASLTIKNFAEVAASGNASLTLPNGQSVGAAQLAEALHPQGVIGQTDLQYGAPEGRLAAGESHDSHLVKKPGANEDIVVKLEPGDAYAFSFNMTEPASVKETDGQLVITFKNGGEIIIPNYGEFKDGGALPDFTLADGTKLSAGEFSEVLASAAQVSQIEPAAGDAGGGGGAGGGFGFGSVFSAGPLDSLGKIGPIDPTQLQYRADFRQLDPNDVDIDYNPTIVAPPAAVVDETNLSPGPVTADGTVTANFFGDGPGTIAADGAFSATGSTAATLTSEGQPVTVTLVGNQYVGTAHGDTIFTLTVNSDGTYHFDLTGTLDHADTTNPDDAINLNFGVTATDNDGDTATTNIVITVKDDGPVANDDHNSFNGEDITTTGNIVTGIEHGTLEPGGTDKFSQDAGNHVTSVSFGGTTVTVPGAGAATIVGANGVLSLYADGTYSYTLNPGVHGDTHDAFTYTLTDGDGDNDTAVLSLDSDGVPTILNPDLDIDASQRTVDETNLAGGPQSVSGTIHADYYTDAPGAITSTGAGSFSASTGLSSHGQPVAVSLAGNTYTGTANGATVFTLTVNTDGSYTFTQFGTLDHPNSANPDDNIELHFGVTATDSDGDSVTSTLTINVRDDGPVANDDHNSFSGEEITTTGNVVTGVEHGVTVPASADHLSQDGGNHVTAVSFGGTTVTVPGAGAATIVGANGVLSLYADGTYSYTLNPGVHGDTHDNFTYTLTDGDGDSDTAILSIDSDGTPTIVNPNDPALNSNDRVVDETDLGTAAATATGNIHADFYSDTPGTLSFGGAGQAFSSSTALTSEGQPVTVSLVGGNYVGTSHGDTIFTLTLDPATGNYTFNLTGTLDHPDATNPDDAIALNFGVTATDSDGDSVTSTLTINVKDDGPVANDDTNNFNAEDHTTTGNVVSGLHGGAGAADHLSRDDGNTVTKVSFGGTTVNVPATGTVTIAGANGVLTLAADGTYSYTLNAGVKGDTHDNFTYTLKDGDGDTDTAILHINSDGTPTIFNPNDPAVSPGERTVDETNLSPNTTVAGHLNANFYSDTPGTFSAQGGSTFTFGGSAAGGALTSEGHPVTVALVGNTYTGTANGATVFTLTINTDGSYSFNLVGTLDHADHTNPDDIIQLNFGVTATDSDGDSDSATLTINVKDDGPVAHDDHNGYNTADGGTHGNVITGDHGGPGAADSLSHDHTNTVTKVSFGTTTVDVPTTGDAVIHGDHGTLTIHSDGSYTYVLDAGAGGGTGGTSVDTPREFTGNSFPTSLPESTPVTDPNVLGEQHGNMTIGAQTTVTGQVTFDGAGYTNSLGLFTIAADGTLQSAAMVTTSINGPGANFAVDPTSGATQLGFFLIADGFTNNGGYAGLDFAHGQLNFLYDAGLPTERPATINDDGGHVTLVFTDAGGVDHNIQGPIYFTSDRGGSNTLNPDGLVHTISGVGSDSHTLTIGFEDLPSGGDHDYNDVVFNVQITDHTTTGGGDVGDHFVYTLTDGDGDNSTAVLYLDGDGQPVIADPATRTVDESDLHGGSTAVSGHVSADFFTDGPGTITPTGTGSFTSSTTLTSEGHPVTVTVAGGVYTGTANGHTVFTLTINPNGDYTFKLDGTLDHPNTGNPDDAINLGFGITATDNDGDHDTSTLTIVVKDDGPVAHNDVNGFNAEAHSTTGNVVTGANGGAGAADTLSQDDNNVISKVTFGGTTVNVPTTGTATIDGANGTLVIKADGSYTYTLNPAAHGDTNDQFTYTLKDGDGDTSTATLTLTSDGTPTLENPNTGSDGRTVDESNLGGGSTSVAGTLHANFYSDTPGSFQPTGAGTFTSSTALTSEGHPVTVTLTGATYTGTADGHTVFTLTVNPNGSYSFNLTGTLDHPDATNPDDAIALNFGVTARDSDGDTDTGTLTINVKDDGPVAHNDTNLFNAEAHATTGNVVTGVNGGAGAADQLSQDDNNVVSKVTFGATTVNVPTTGTATIIGDNGTLVIKADGSYTYTLKAGVHGDTADNFTYTLKDGDGDTSNAILQVKSDGTPTICDPNDPNVSPGARTVDETNLAPNTSVSGHLAANFYSDTPGTFQATGAATFSFGGSTNGSLTSEGQPVTVALAGNVYTGTSHGQTIFTLTVNTDGSYKFDLKGTLDHADKSNPDDIIKLNFGVTARDSDGDTDSATLTINVKDDGPVAHDDHNTFNMAGGPATGNVISGVNGGAGAADHLSQDDVNHVTKVVFEGHSVDVPATGSTTIAGHHGTLTIASDGSYSYQLNAGSMGGSTVDTPRSFTGNTFPTLPGESVHITPGQTAALGEEHGNMAINANTTVSGQITFEGAGYTNSLGVFTIAADGTLQAAQIVAPQINGPGANFNLGANAGASELGFFLVADGFTNNHGYAGLDFAHGQLNFVYDQGLGTERVATINDGGSHVSLVFTDAAGVDHVIQGPVYFTSDRGGSNSLNGDGVVHTLSGVGTDSHTLTIAFEDLPNGGDNDYNDVVFNVQLTDHTVVGCDCGTDQFTYVLTDGDGDSSNAVLDFTCLPPTVNQPDLTTCDLWVKEDHSIALNVQAHLVNPTAGEQLTVSVSGIKDGWGVDTSVSGGTYNAATHTWTLTLAPGITSFSGGPTVTPPANSDADMPGLHVTATASNGVNSASAAGTENVYVDAVADAITVTATDANGHDNTAIALSINVSTAVDTDGSEGVTKVVISGVPTGGLLNHGALQSDGTWLLSKADLSGLKLTPPGGFMGNIALTVTATEKETNLSGLENDLNDNTYVATTHLNVGVVCDPNPPTLAVCDVWVKEDHSVALNVQASLNFPHAGEHLVITISGFQPGWTVNTSASGGTYNSTTGTWTITLPNGVNFSGGPTVTPPHDSDLDLTGLHVTATSTDGVYSATTNGTENVFVDAVVDVPVLTVPASVNYLWIVNQTNPSALPVSTHATDTDNSETVTKVTLNLNNAFTNPSGGYYSLEDIGVKLNKGTETSPGIWTINVNNKDASTALNGLALSTPTSDGYYWALHNGPHSGTIEVQSYVKETTLGGLENDTSDNSTIVTAYICYTFSVSPLVLDLNHNGFDIVGQENGVRFDMTNDGQADKTSWVAANDGFLAIDANHDGVIGSQSELFGNNATAGDGFSNLAQYDSNGDGVVNANDAKFGELLVWQDLNQDGVSQAGELQSLSAHGIASISLDSAVSGQVIADSGVSATSTVTYADGSTTQIGDVWFNVQDAADHTGVTFHGSDLDDAVTGTYKNDFLGGGAGYNELTGGEGGDTFLLDAAGVAVIHDFNLAAGDSLDLSDILTTYDPLTDSLHNFVHTVSDGADTLIQVDPTGTGAAFTTVAVLEGVHLDVNALQAHGNLIA